MSAETILISIGWVATLVIAASLFTANRISLRKFQLLGAALWTLYGITIASIPIIVANVLLVSAATWMTVSRTGKSGSGRGSLSQLPRKMSV